jgi:DNA-binding transcriptional MerR regulator
MVAPVPRKRRFSKDDLRWLDMVEQWRALGRMIQAHEAAFQRPDGVDAEDVARALGGALGPTEAVMAIMAKATSLLYPEEVLAKVERGQFYEGDLNVQRVREILSTAKTQGQLELIGGRYGRKELASSVELPGNSSNPTGNRIPRDTD